MLVLSRRIGEEIVIDGNIRLTVVEMRSGSVRIGIEAPPSVTMDRMEVHLRRAQQTAASDQLENGFLFFDDAPLSTQAGMGVEQLTV